MIIVSLGSANTKSGIYRFHFAALLIALLLALGSYTPVFKILAVIPGYIFRIPARFLLAFALSGSVLSAYGYDALMQFNAKVDLKKCKIIMVASFVISCLVFSLVFSINKEFLNIPVESFRENLMNMRNFSCL